MEELIKRFAKGNQIDLIGITNFNQDDDLVVLKKQKYLNPFINKKRLTKNQELDKYTQAIVIGVAYPSYDVKLEEDHITSFSSSSWGIDYHVVLKNRLNLLADYLKTLIHDLKYKIMVDTGPVNERLLGFQAGLGFFGKNNMLINPHYGSSFFIGVLLTNTNLEIDLPINTNCSNCDRCIKACPTKALAENNSLKCVSYLTQKKGLTKEEEKHIKDHVFGCSICQVVCPFNKGINNTHQEFIPTGIEFIKDQDAFNLTNQEFKLQYGHLAGSFVGQKRLRRNLELIIKNKD